MSTATLDWRLVERQDVISLSRGSERVYSFSRDGRPLSYFRAGDFYQRGLGNSLLHKHRRLRPEGPQLLRERLNAAESEALLQEIYTELLSLPSHAGSAALRERLLAWTPARLAAEASRFAAVYQPISILPPDQYLSVVVQLSLGCAYNRCHFCNFYKDRAFRVRSEAEFAAHLEAVADFLGPGLALRKGVFLADGDALMTPMPRLRAAMQLLRTRWPALPVYSFMDAFRPGAKRDADLAELKQLGLRRVYLGIETGDPALLSWLGKPGSPELMLAEARRMRAAGLSLGLIFMVGAGGQTYAEAHREASLAWLRALQPGPDDLIFLSAFVPHPDQPYAARAEAAGIIALSESELAGELGAWRAGLRASAGLQARVVPYHLQEFIY